MPRPTDWGFVQVAELLLMRLLKDMGLKLWANVACFFSGLLRGPNWPRRLKYVQN